MKGFPFSASFLLDFITLGCVKANSLLFELSGMNKFQNSMRYSGGNRAYQVYDFHSFCGR